MRYERKYRIEGLSLPLLLQSLRLHPAGIRPIHQARQINNIYFDSPALSTYKANVNGEAIREKYRVRWYGKLLRNVQQAQLEIKIRNNEVGTKEITPVAAFHLGYLKKLSQEVNQICSNSSGLLHPVLLNSYQRQYFATADQKFRLTVDRQLQYTPLLQASYLFGHHFSEENICILELKYDQDLEPEADRITQFLPYRRSKNSKYVSGIELCYS